MKIEFDSAKSEANIRERGLAFDLIAEFDFDEAWIAIDNRQDYGELRYRAIGPLGGEIVAVVFTLRKDALRVISLRHASRKERQRYNEKS